MNATVAYMKLKGAVIVRDTSDNLVAIVPDITYQIVSTDDVVFIFGEAFPAKGPKAFSTIVKESAFVEALKSEKEDPIFLPDPISVDTFLRRHCGNKD